MEPIEPSFVIKICGITNEEDARVAVEAGATALGFNFYTKSPRYVSWSRAREIVSAASGEYLKVGIFVNASFEEIDQCGRLVPLDVLQLHGTPPQRLPGGYRVWRSIPGDSRPAHHEPAFEAYLLDSVTPAYGGSGRTFDWERAQSFPFRAVLAGGLDGSNVGAAIRTVQPWGVDACSRIESRPGKKDPDKLRAFIEAARGGSVALKEVLT
jgi:phosphoribosylanthranilate isomerase